MLWLSQLVLWSVSTRSNLISANKWKAMAMLTTYFKLNKPVTQGVIRVLVTLNGSRNNTIHAFEVLQELIFGNGAMQVTHKECAIVGIMLILSIVLLYLCNNVDILRTSGIRLDNLVALTFFLCVCLWHCVFILSWCGIVFTFGMDLKIWSQKQFLAKIECLSSSSKPGPQNGRCTKVTKTTNIKRCMLKLDAQAFL